MPSLGIFLYVLRWNLCPPYGLLDSEAGWSGDEAPNLFWGEWGAGGGAGWRLVSLLLICLLPLLEFWGTTDAASYDLLGHTDLLSLA